MDNKRKLRILMLQAGIDHHYQLAEILGIREESLSRKIRNLSDETLKEIEEKIKEYQSELKDGVVENAED